MAHLLDIMKRRGAENARTEDEEEDPGASDKIPDEKHREDDLVSACEKYSLIIFNSHTTLPQFILLAGS